MRHRSLALPTLASIAATRGILGAGLGLLAAPRLRKRRRKMVGLTLVGIGIVSTIPLAAMVLRARA